MNKKFNLFLLVFCLLILTSCSQEFCVEADDFGIPRVKVQVRPEKLYGEKENQVTPWQDSGYLLSGDPLMIVVKNWNYSSSYKKGDRNSERELSAWCPWYTKVDNRKTLSSFCLRLIECQFKKYDGTDYYKVINAPCLMKKGFGLYALTAFGLSTINPNDSILDQISPNENIGVAFHVGDASKNEEGVAIKLANKKGELQDAGGIMFNYQERTNFPGYKFANGRLYFKILDSYYEDDGGQYIVLLKSGIVDLSGDPFQTIINLVKEMLFGKSVSTATDTSNKGIIDKLSNSNQTNPGIVQKIFTSIVAQHDYQLSVKALLTSYVIFTTIAFLLGVVNVTHQELFLRIFKVIIISQLMSSETAWSFFYDKLLFIFIHGPDFIMYLFKSIATTGPGSESIVGLMIAPQTLTKLFSLLLFALDGFIYIILYFIALYFILIVLFRATMIYLQALVMISIIIIMAPIFLCFSLFQITRSFFDNWLKQLVSYVVQPIVLFTGIAFMSIIMRHQIYASLGFQVCRYEFPDLGPLIDYIDNALDLDINVSLFSWWFPSPPTRGEFSREHGKIYVPDAHFQTDINPNLDNGICNSKAQYDQYTFVQDVAQGKIIEKMETKFCKPYECVEHRYIELPFLDPSITSDCTRLKKFFNGTFVQYDGLILLVVVIYLLGKFNNVAISIGSFIAGSSGNLTQLQTAGESAVSGFKDTNAYKFASDSIKNTKAYKSISNFTDKIDNAYTKVRNFVPTLYSGLQTNRLQKQSLSNPTKSVEQRVKNEYGIDKKDLNLKAKGQYIDTMKETLKKVNPSITDKSITECINNSTSLSKFKDQLAKLKHGEAYDKLDKDKKEELNKLINDKNNSSKKSLSDLDKDVDKLKDFQQKYVDTHQKMSQEGIGFFGKRIGGLKKLQELSHRIKKAELQKEEKRTALAERLYSGYEGLKHYITKGKLGESWHGFDVNDSRFRTYAEQIREKQFLLEGEKFKKQMYSINSSIGKDALQSKNIAQLMLEGKLDKVNKYYSLSKKDIEYKVYNSVTSGINSSDGTGFDDSPIMGDKYMRERMKESEFRKSIDNIYRKQEILIKEDPYLKGREKFNTIFNNTKEVINNYKTEFQKTSFDEVNNMLKDPKNNLSIEKRAELSKAIKDYEYSRRVIYNMDIRENQIKNEYGKYINKINDYRSKFIGEFKQFRPFVPENVQMPKI